MSLDTLKLRYGYDKLSNWGIDEKYFNDTSEDKVNEIITISYDKNFLKNC